jgi:tyrosine-protein kinase Etk/Wzc
MAVKMNEATPLKNNPSDHAGHDLGLIDLLIMLARHKKKLMGSALLAGLLAAGGSFLLPDVYSANTKLLPPQQAQSGAAALLSQVGGAGSLAAGMTGLKSPSEMYIGMLTSRTVADRLIAAFDLKKVYGTQSQDETRDALSRATAIAVGKDGLISIEVEDQDRALVARLANAYADELKRLTSVLALSEASQRRLFFEQQLELAKNRLAQSEISLKQALGTRGVISVDAESAAIVETGARLRAQISAKEVQLASMKAFVTADNPEYRRVVEELSSLRNELAKLQNGRPSESTGQPVSGGLENIAMLRDVKYYQMLYEVLAKQYEMARLDEAKDHAVVQVLDPAVTPERRARPKRALIVLIAPHLR